MSDSPIPVSAYRLDAVSIVATLTRLRDRITERFPDSGLQRVCGELVATGRDTARSVEALSRPLFWLRLLAAVERHAPAGGVTWEWTRGHAGDPLNERVDRLANAAANSVTAADPVDVNLDETGSPPGQTGAGV